MDKNEISPEERQVTFESLSEQLRNQEIGIEDFLGSLGIDPNAILCGSNASSLEVLVQQFLKLAKTL